MKHVIITIIVSLVAVSFIYAQEPVTVERLKNDREKRRGSAIENIRELKEGALLVRLDQQERRIDYYQKYNNENEVRKIKAKALKENLAIINAFKTYYKFGNVYYMAMEDSRLLLEGKIDQIRFYNDSGQVDKRIVPSEVNFFVADFSYVEQDTSIFLSSYTPTPNDPNNPRGETYFGGSKTSKPALVIRNDNFQQLRDPFPFYTSYSPFGKVSKKFRLPVKRLQEQLEIFYEKTTAKNTQ